MALQLQIGSKYNFESYQIPGYPVIFKNATLEATVSSRQAAKTSDINAIHAQILGQLPVGTSPDASMFTYYVFRTELGTELTIADAWIKLSTILQVTSGKAVFGVSGITTADVEIIRDLILARGYNLTSTSFINT